MTTSQEPAADARVNAAVQEYLERIDRGEIVDKARFLAPFPADVADSVRSFIEGSENLAQLARRNEASAISTNSVAAAASFVGGSAKPPGRSAAPGGSQFDVLPTDFGRYRVQKLLGRGAMGAVFLADDRQLERQVALKIPSFEQDQNGDLLTRFYREARSAALLRQPNICPVYDVGEIDGQHYITMAYIAGRTLSELIRSDKPPGERQTLLVARKLALALQEAHSQGIIHRDLKPGNVMVDARGEPIVMDFGLACRMEQEDAARLTHSGVIVGSPAYMSPEQVEGNPDNVTPAADQYSLGVMLYEMLTGQLPFKGSIAAVIAQIATKMPKPPRELKPEIDPRVEAVCLRMLSKTAKDRFPSLKAVADELAIILREPKTATATPVQETSTVAPSASTTTSMSDRQREIQTLLKNGELTTAQEALKALAALTDPRQQKSADWAKQQLAKLKADGQRWETEAPQLLDLAKQLVRKHDYAGAAGLLGQVPAAFRSQALADVLDQAVEKRDESDALLAEIDKAVRKEQSKELPALVKRLLQLKPGHIGVQRLAADMKKHGVERAMRVRKGDRKYLDAAGQVWNPLHLAYAACGLAALCFAAYCTVIAFQTKYGTVVVEVKDPGLNVSFHNDVVTLESSGKKYQLKPTDRQTLEIEHDGLTFVSPMVEVKKGGVTQVVAYLEASKPALTVNGATQILTPKTNIASVPNPLDSSHPADAVAHNGHFYKFFPEKLSWSEAKRRCEALGGHLPVVENQAENDFLVALCAGKFPASENLGGAAIWLGASDAAKEGDWRELDGSPVVFTKWYGQQPNNGGIKADEHFATMLLHNLSEQSPAGSWSDQPDEATKQDVYFVCEWDDAAPSSDNWRDLLAPFDVAASSSPNMSWSREGTKLVGKLGPARPVGWVTFKSAEQITGDYDLEMDLLSVGSHPVLISLPLDGAEAKFSFGDSGTSYHRIETKPTPDVKLRLGVVQRLEVSVRHRGEEVAVNAKVDGAPAASFSKPRSQLDQNDPAGPYYNRINIAAPFNDKGANDRIEIVKAQLRPVKPKSASTRLFNGKDLAGWTQSPATPSTWQVVDGILTGQSKEGSSYLISNRGDYRNFRLTVQAMYGATNSGLYFRAQPNGDKAVRGFEADMLSSKSTVTGTLYLSGTNPLRTAQDAQGPSPARGQWFTMTVECIDQDIAVAIDGRNVAKYRDESNYATSGHIMLQAYLGPIKYRSIDIVELPDGANTKAAPPGFTDLLNTRDLANWEIRESLPDPAKPNQFPAHRASTTGWENRSGTLVCTTDKPAWIRSRKEYGDFIMQLDFKRIPNAYCGFFLRMPESDLGMEVLLADDLLKKTWAGSIYQAAAAFKAAAHPVEQWNALEVTCRGDDITIKLNDQVVNEVRMSVNDALKNRPRKGYLGLSNWFGKAKGCEFRNIRIKELSPTTTAVPQVIIGATPTPPRVPKKETWLIPTSEKEPQEWLCKMSNNLLNPEDYMESIKGFSTRKGPFGDGNINGGKFGCKWDKRHIAIRKTIMLPTLTDKSLVLRIAHDDSAWIYVNGKALDFTPNWGSVHLSGTDQVHVDIPLSTEQQRLFVVGSNRFIVWCENIDSPQFLDVGLKLLEY